MLATINRLLQRHLDIVLLSCFGVGLLAIRAFFLSSGSHGELFHAYTPRHHFLFLIWNLFLAWIPLFLQVFLQKTEPSKWLVAPVLVVWLLFFPNAPYLITDLLHLRPRVGIPLWYDAFMLFTFAALGLLIAVHALQEMRTYLRKQFGTLPAQLFIGLTLLLSGLGVYLGRVERWNSWDVFSDPLGPVRDTLLLLASPTDHLQAWLMIVVVSGLLVVCSISRAFTWGR